MVSIKAADESFDHFGFVGFEGVQVFSFSNFELGDSLVSLDEDG